MGPPAEQANRLYTVEEYLRIERDASEKHEYRDGQILAMAGGTVNHSLIVANVVSELHGALKGKRCRVFESNLRVRIPRTPLYTYPDATVICGPVQIDPRDSSGQTVTNPRLIVEVLSPSTEGYDRGEKFHRYLLLDSLEEYVLVSQETPQVETFFRQTGGSWLFTPVSNLESRLLLRSLQIELSLAEIYAGVEFPPPLPPPNQLPSAPLAPTAPPAPGQPQT